MASYNLGFTVWKERQLRHSKKTTVEHQKHMGKANKSAQIIAAMAAAQIMAPPVGRSVKPASGKAASAKDALLAEFNASLASVKSAHQEMGKAATAAAQARGGFKAIVAKMKGSGLFTDAELIKLCKDAVKAESISESGASRALTAVGIKQRASGAGRPPNGGKGDKGDDADDAGDDAGEPEIVPAPEAAPLTASALAAFVLAKLGKEKALALLSEAYHTAKASA